jgi:hypothetical protein
MHPFFRAVASVVALIWFTGCLRCVVRGKWNEIMGFCEDTMVFENNDSESMYFKMMNHAESIMVEVFGARYCWNNPTPACIQGVVGNYFETKAQMEEEEEAGPR